MGGDGGSIPTRRCLVPQKRRKAKKDARFQNSGKFNYCQLSMAKLKKPILCSRHGKLYNKDSVIEYLLDKNKLKQEGCEDKLEGLHSLKKDFTEVNISENPEFVEKWTPGNSFTNGFPFQCPVTRVDLNGVNPVVFSRLTKNVVTLKALRDANSDILPKSVMNFELTEDSKDENILHPILSEVYEDKLVDPVSSQPFGRIFQLYPESRSELGRAMKWNPKKDKKDKKEKKEALSIEGAPTTTPTKKKGIKFASFVEDNEGGFTNMGHKLLEETPGLEKLKSLKQSKSSKSLSKSALDLSQPKTDKVNMKPKQKTVSSSIKSKTMRVLAEDISVRAGKSNQIEKYRELNLIGDTSRIVDTDGNALKHMMGIQRAYHLS